MPHKLSDHPPSPLDAASSRARHALGLCVTHGCEVEIAPPIVSVWPPEGGAFPEWLRPSVRAARDDMIEMAAALRARDAHLYPAEAWLFGVPYESADKTIRFVIRDATHEDLARCAAVHLRRARGLQLRRAEANAIAALLDAPPSRLERECGGA